MEVVNEMIKEAHNEYLNHLRAKVDDAREQAERLYHEGRYEAAARYAKRYRALYQQLQEAQQNEPFEFFHEDAVGFLFNTVKRYFDEASNEFYRLTYFYYMDDNKAMKTDALRIKHQINSVGRLVREITQGWEPSELTTLIDEMVTF